MALFLVVLSCLVFACFAQNDDAAIHLPLMRRGGRLSRHEPANLSHLAGLVEQAEAQYARCYRQVEGNRIVRRWRATGASDENDPDLVDAAGKDNHWYGRGRYITLAC